MQDESSDHGEEPVPSTGSCWGDPRENKDVADAVFVLKRHHQGLRPPPLFRTIAGLTDAYASLLPHRRLRSIFRRSRTVLPADSRSEVRVCRLQQTVPHSGSQSQASTLAQTDRLTGIGGQEKANPLKQIVVLTQMCTRAHTGCVTQTDTLTQTGLPEQTSPQTSAATGKIIPLTAEFASNPSSCSSILPLAPPFVTHWDAKRIWSGEVSPLRHTAGAGLTKRRSVRRSVANKTRPKPVDQPEGSTPTPENMEEGRLCQWLQSLEIADKGGNSPPSTLSSGPRVKTCLKFGLGRKEEGQDTGQMTSHRRDRRPHFLPPIAQSESFLHVPLIRPHLRLVHPQMSHSFPCQFHSFIRSIERKEAEMIHLVFLNRQLRMTCHP